MTRYHGPQHRGASREGRTQRRLAAEMRNDVTPPERCRPNPTDPERNCE